MSNPTNKDYLKNIVYGYCNDLIHSKSITNVSTERVPILNYVQIQTDDRDGYKNSLILGIVKGKYGEYGLVSDSINFLEPGNFDISVEFPIFIDEDKSKVIKALRELADELEKSE